MRDKDSDEEKREEDRSGEPRERGKRKGGEEIKDDGEKKREMEPGAK